MRLRDKSKKKFSKVRVNAGRIHLRSYAQRLSHCQNVFARAINPVFESLTGLESLESLTGAGDSNMHHVLAQRIFGRGHKKLIFASIHSKCSRNIPAPNSHCASNSHRNQINVLVCTRAPFSCVHVYCIYFRRSEVRFFVRVVISEIYPVPENLGLLTQPACRKFNLPEVC